LNDFSTTRSGTRALGRCPADCKEAMAIAREDVNRIKRQGAGVADMDMKKGTYREIPGEVMRNGHITKAYTDLARDMPQNDWVRLASYVSVQGGCAMRQVSNWKDYHPGRMLLNPEKALDALGDANMAIFESIYPPNRMAANCGIDKFLECVEKGEIKVDEKIVQAMREMKAGNNKRAADLIADHEQRNVVQPVYERHKGAFNDLSNADSWVPGDQTSIPVAKTCTRENLVKLDGDISNPSDRVAYYEKLIRRMYEIEGRR
jgi:hypothetical protein